MWSTSRKLDLGMAGTEDGRTDQGRRSPEIVDDGHNSFAWDEQSGLYYHPSSGFYHDPESGWYYNTNDGIYYKFEDGRYIPWDSILEDGSGNGHVSTNEAIDDLPPSEWLEETLINLFLSGYSNEAASENYCERDGMNVVEEAKDEGESREQTLQDISSCEETWLAQYGQVIKSEPEALPTFPIIDLWEWKVVNEKVKGRELLTRLVGKPVQRSKKLHPSMPAGDRYLKSAPVCKVNLDLVQVETGKVYRLRNPKVEHLQSLSNYDSSDPTKDWGFPRLDLESLTLSTSQPKSSKSMILKDSSTSAKIHHQHYRDRASERRSLHGGSGIGIGQKCHHGGDDIVDGDMTYESYHGDEPIFNAFSSQSYGRRLLERMGWEEGKAIGKTKNGLLEPLQVAGNKGTAGLGWSNERII